MVDQIPMRDSARQVPHLAEVGLQVTRPDIPVPVDAWIVDGRGRDVQIAAEAVAWTPRTVRLHYFDVGGREGWVTVWASAVTRRR